MTSLFFWIKYVKMPSSIKLFKVAGISIQLHVSFILFFFFIALFGLNELVFFAMVFSLVLIHEFVHSLAALASKVPVSKITLYPIGGLASIELPRDPLTELKVSLAGPMSNFAMAFFTAILIFLSGVGFISYGELTRGLVEGSLNLFSVAALLNLALSLNLVLGGFNMAPAFPMDGGRIFRSVLAFWMDYATATKISVYVGRMMFLVLLLAGFLTFNVWWIIISLFLMVAGGGELRMVDLVDRLGDKRLKDVVITDIGHANQELTMREFLDIVKSPLNRYYLVSNSSGDFKGYIDVEKLEGEDVEGGKRIVDYCLSDYSVIDAGEKVEPNMRKILVGDFTLVSAGGKIVGYVTRDSIGAGSLRVR